MTQINERIEWLKNAIKTLRRFREAKDFSKIKESELIISICEYSEELEQLESIRKANRSLF